MVSRSLLMLLTLPLLATAHGGGLDGNGGHTNRKTGEYHCHREPCFSLHRQQQEAVDEAEREGRGYSSLYDRDAWPHWRDLDGDCQDARAEALISASRVQVTFRNGDRCVVESGLWIDPYSGQVFQDASELDVDHIVPLRHAHGHGGDRWPAARRARFANDPQNLLPVSASANRSKGAEGPDTWLPPQRSYWCDYGRRWAAIKAKYGLMVTPRERQALRELVGSCGGG